MTNLGWVRTGARRNTSTQRPAPLALGMPRRQLLIAPDHARPVKRSSASMPMHGTVGGGAAHFCQLLASLLLPASNLANIMEIEILANLANTDAPWRSAERQRRDGGRPRRVEPAALRAIRDGGQPGQPPGLGGGILRRRCRHRQRGGSSSPARARRRDVPLAAPMLAVATSHVRVPSQRASFDLPRAAARTRTERIAPRGADSVASGRDFGLSAAPLHQLTPPPHAPLATAAKRPRSNAGTPRTRGCGPTSRAAEGSTRASTRTTGRRGPSPAGSTDNASRGA